MYCLIYTPSHLPTHLRSTKGCGYYIPTNTISTIEKFLVHFRVVSDFTLLSRLCVDLGTQVRTSPDSLWTGSYFRTGFVEKGRGRGVGVGVWVLGGPLGTRLDWGR